MSNSDLKAKATAYATLSGISLNLKTPLGYGNDGVVWQSSRQTAVKAFEREFKYLRERDCYRRFQQHKVRSIQGLTIPELIGYDNELMIVEIRIVTPPYLLDFAKAYLDSKPDFPPETMEEWEQEGLDNFGDRWADVRVVLWVLTKYGIYYYDAKPGNINFGNIG